MTKLYTRVTARLSTALLLVLLLLGMADAVTAQEQAATPQAISSFSAEEAVAAAMDENGALRFEVAEDGMNFVYDPDHAHEDGMPAYGASFITRGYIYPAGTLNESNGVNADGSPEFPEKVLGEWICRGWMVGEGMRTTTGVMVITTQLFSFGDEQGSAMLVTDGHELADVGVEITRAVTGGTGSFTGDGGEARQSLLGLNVTEGVNLQFELELNDSGS